MNHLGYEIEIVRKALGVHTILKKNVFFQLLVYNVYYTPILTYLPQMLYSLSVFLPGYLTLLVCQASFLFAKRRRIRKLPLTIDFFSNARNQA